MASFIRHRTFRQGIEKRTLNKLTRHSYTLFLCIVALSSVLLYSTSKMLQDNQDHSQFHIRVIEKRAEFKKEKKSKQKLLQSLSSNHLKDDGLLNYRLATLNEEENNEAKTMKNLEKPSNAIEACKSLTIFLLILIFSEETQSTSRDFIRTTWCNDESRRMTCLFVIGQHSSKQEFTNDMLQEAEKEQDIILVPVYDDIRNTTLKLLKSVKWVISNCLSVRYIMRTEDDVILNSKTLMKNVASQFLEKSFMGGKCIANQRPVRNQYSKYYVSRNEYPQKTYPSICNRMGYVLSFDLFFRLLEIPLETEYIPLDNIFVGVGLKNLQITPINLSNLLHGKAYQLLHDHPKILCDYAIIHLHGNTEDETWKLWNAMQKDCSTK